MQHAAFCFIALHHHLLRSCSLSIIHMQHEDASPAPVSRSRGSAPPGAPCVVDWPCRRTAGAPPGSEPASSGPPGSRSTSRNTQLSCRTSRSPDARTWCSSRGPRRIQGGTCKTGRRPLSGTYSDVGRLWTLRPPPERDAPWVDGPSRSYCSRRAHSDARLGSERDITGRRMSGGVTTPRRCCWLSPSVILILNSIKTMPCCSHTPHPAHMSKSDLPSVFLSPRRGLSLLFQSEMTWQLVNI